MLQQALLKKAVSALNAAGIDYMLSGSYTSSFYGEPRTTYDIDLVVDMKASHLKRLQQAFPESDYYLSDIAVYEAIERQSMFNIIEMASNDKIDFHLLTDQPFDQSRFARRQSRRILGIDLTMASPEDTILMKLKWSKMAGGSEKQFQDALRVYEVQFVFLDLQYIEQWMAKLGIEPLWLRLIEEAKPIKNED